MLIVKTEKKLGSPNSFRRYDKCNMPRFPQYGAILTLLRVTGTIAIAQPLMNFLMIFFLSSARKYGILANQIQLTCIVVEKRCLPVFTDMLLWEACAKNVKYYKL